MPVNPPEGRITIEATELFSGMQARLPVEVRRPAGAIKLAEPPPADVRSGTVGSTIGRATAAGTVPPERRFGPHIRDVAITPDGSLAVMNTMNWNENLCAIDAATGKVRWQKRIGNYFAFAPQALPDGFAVQGYDFNSAEGYHLYLGDNDGSLTRRFALYGLPKRLPFWFLPGEFYDRINNFAVAPDGSWIAAAGDMGLAVWGRSGKLLWSDDWHETARHTVVLTAADERTLVTVEGTTAAGRDAATGRQLWQVALASTGDVLEGTVSADGKTLALRATTDGGRVFIPVSYTHLTLPTTPYV